MRNTFNISQLRQRILGALPRALTSVGERALEGFLALDGISMWRPDRLGVLQLSFVFDIGLPFGLIGDNPSIKPLAMRVGDAARDGQYPDLDAWRVVHTGALLCHWGATVNFITDAATPAVRLEVERADGAALDVDVISGPSPAHAPSQRSRLIAIDARDRDVTHAQIALSCAAGFARSADVSGVLVFEPRFWVGIEQKEWIHQAQLNPDAAVPVAAEMLGGADTGRHALRLALLS